MDPVISENIITYKTSGTYPDDLSKKKKTSL